MSLFITLKYSSLTASKRGEYVKPPQTNSSGPHSNWSDCSPNGSDVKSPLNCSIFGRNKSRLINGLPCMWLLLKLGIASYAEQFKSNKRITKNDDCCRIPYKRGKKCLDCQSVLLILIGTVATKERKLHHEENDIGPPCSGHHLQCSTKKEVC